VAAESLAPIAKQTRLLASAKDPTTVDVINSALRLRMLSSDGRKVERLSGDTASDSPGGAQEKEPQKNKCDRRRPFFTLPTRFGPSNYRNSKPPK
jgi:hypothetical protein